LEGSHPFCDLEERKDEEELKRGNQWRFRLKEMNKENEQEMKCL